MDELERRITDIEMRLANYQSAFPHVISGVSIANSTVKAATATISGAVSADTVSASTSISADVISEVTSATGVTIDGLTIKDSTFTGDHLLWVRCDKDSDGDFDPYTSTSWDGDSFDDAASGTINWNSVFGVPTTAKMVALSVQVRDSGSSGGQYSINFYAKSTTDNPSLRALAPRSGNDHLGQAGGIVAISAAGTSYYLVTASGVGTFDVWIRVTAYAI